MPGSDAGLDSARPSAFSQPMELRVQGLDVALEDIRRLVSARAISIMCAQCDVPLASGIRWKSESLEPSRTPERSQRLNANPEMVCMQMRCHGQAGRTGRCGRSGNRTEYIGYLVFQVQGSRWLLTKT
ncbi:hypothetical protein M0657_011054 [Pyricularia oryzae]|nr:hypothetical protein M0657_011054 [Pyricularia oryzae]